MRYGAGRALRRALANATIVGIDVSARSLEFGRQLARKHAIENLELHELPVERASELERAFDQIVCTGVLHHVADPQAGLAALREVMAPEGALHIMVYAPYGRSGIYMLQDFFRRLGWGDGNDDVAALAATLKALPADHPIVPLLRHSPDFASTAGLADALLHPQDRAYTVAQFFEILIGRPAIRPLGPPGAVLARVRRIGIDAARRSAGRPERTRTICGDGALSRYDGSPQRHCSSQR